MANPSDRHVLITGLSGFTGRHLAKLLVDDGWRVSGLSNGGDDGGFPSFIADIAEPVALEAVFAEARPTHVVHLAAMSHVVGDPLSFYRVNLLGTENLLNAITASGVVPQKILIASSANIYGQTDNSPISETQLPRPANHYAISKVAMELLVGQWIDRLPILVARPFNYTGPGQSEAFVFSKIVGAYHRRDAVLKLGNINISRDLSDVRFVVEAYRRLLLSPLVGDVFNICSGRGIAIREALAILQGLTGHHVKIETDADLVRESDINQLVGDSSKLQATVGPLEPIPPETIFATMLENLDHSAK